ncbi:acyl-CoA thioesterase-1 [Loktanella ponticola]|uniref:Acyl-CoA thioesterase-1 n=1 Tax=Yoonia ponticola TaxID=1524255 RepID=A0A7W9EYY2_9RHOB|nr:arylesterase [Yoonia ponticola]MBB5723174.1 acyl-CoA thioesterase-1 [Yoonia ponticola]
MARAFNNVFTFGYGAVGVVRNLCMVTVLTTGYAAADELVIAALGDSLTAGYGLSQGDGFVPQMDAWLEGQGIEVDLRNAGVSGDTTAGGLSRVDWTLTPDVDGMIVALGGNDYLRGLDPAGSRANLRRILEVAASKDVDVMLVGLRAGSNYGPEYQTAFNAMYSELAAEFDVPLFPGFFQGLQAVAGMQDGVSEYMQRDGIHPNADGVKVIVAAMGPDVLTFAKGLAD